MHFDTGHTVGKSYGQVKPISYYNSTMMEFHNVHMKIFNLEGGLWVGWLCKNRMTPTGHSARSACARSVIVVHKCAQVMSVPTHFKPDTLRLISPFRVGEKSQCIFGPRTAMVS